MNRPVQPQARDGFLFSPLFTCGFTVRGGPGKAPDIGFSIEDASNLRRCGGIRKFIICKAFAFMLY